MNPPEKVRDLRWSPDGERVLDLHWTNVNAHGVRWTVVDKTWIVWFGVEDGICAYASYARFDLAPEVIKRRKVRLYIPSVAEAFAELGYEVVP